MWRGFAVKKGTPAEAIKWWQDLCQKVAEDPEWIEYNTNKSYIVQNVGTEEFTAQVQQDMVDHLAILKLAEMVSEEYTID